jgi:fungalysin/thermolysin propeptide
MPSGFHDLYFHIADEAADRPRGIGARAPTLRGATMSARASELAPNQEAAARMYLSAVLGGQDRPPTMRSLTAPDRPELVPDLRLRDTQTLPRTDAKAARDARYRETTLVRFVQTARSIPIFGSRAVVELDPNNELVAVDASLANVKGVSHIPALSVAQALQRIADSSGATIEQLQNVNAPELTFFHDEEKDKWHLAYFFENVPAAPNEFVQGLKSHGVGRSPGQRHPELDYLVVLQPSRKKDGRTTILHLTLRAELRVPAQCREALQQPGCQRTRPFAPGRACGDIAAR